MKRMILIHGINFGCQSFFQNNELSLSTLLPTYLYKAPKSKLTPQEKRQLQKLLRENQSLTSISSQMSRSEREIIDEVVVLIRTGYPVTKTHLANLVGANDEIFRFLKSNLTSEDLSNVDNIASVHAKFTDNPSITEQMLVLVINYLKVRQFLRSIKVPYFDADENQLVNGSVLLESNPVDTIKVNVSQSDTNNKIASNIAHDDCEESGSQSLAGFVSLIQDGQSSQVSNLLDEDEDDFAALVAHYDSKTDTTAAKPLQNSQKPNQSIDVKKFEAKPVTKMPSNGTTNAGKASTTSKKRTIAASKYAIQYCSDSDSDSNDQQTVDSAEPQAKRALPQWMSAKRSTNDKKHTNSQSVVVRKKSFF